MIAKLSFTKFPSSIFFRGFFLSIVLSLFFISSVLSQEEKQEFISEASQESLPEDDLPQEPAILPEEKPVTPASSASSTTSTGNRISLDIKGMDIIDVLKMLATRAGLNIVVGKNVTGRVTLFLKDVDVNDAFELVLLANDLAYEKKGEIINVMSQRDYELLYGQRYQDKKQAKTIQLKYAKAADLSRALNQIKTNIGRIVVDESSNTLVLIDAPEKLKEMQDFIKQTDLPIQTKVFSLNYAQAEKITPKIQEAITKGVGSIRIDERTNKIVVTDYPERLDEIAKIISAFDEKTPQVLIDAQIIEIRPSDKFEMGIDWDYWIKNHFKVTSALPMGSSGRLLLGTTTTTPTAVGDYKAILDLLRTIGETKILSSPRIMAVNNQEAKILVGSKEAYITETITTPSTGSAVTAESVNFVDVGIKLYVTPTINRDGFVTMKIKPEISSHEYVNFGTDSAPKKIPVVTTSEAETSVMLKDGVTIIIGGLQKEQRIKNVTKIPILGDIPLLGFFFRKTSDELTKKDLVILLTPHILTGEISYTDFSEIKPKDGIVAKMVRGDIVKERVIGNTDNKDAINEYYKLITDKIRALTLFNQPKGIKGSVEVSFVLDSRGQLKGNPVVISSTNQELNNAAMESIKNASPFPSPPVDLSQTEESFRITLEFK